MYWEKDKLVFAAIAPARNISSSSEILNNVLSIKDHCGLTLSTSEKPLILCTENPSETLCDHMVSHSATWTSSRAYILTRFAVITETRITDFFKIITGVREGCILSPLLFRIIIVLALKKTAIEPNRRISPKEQTRPKDLDFADDTVDDLHRLTTTLEYNVGNLGTEKTQIISVISNKVSMVIQVDQLNVEVVDNPLWIA